MKHPLALAAGFLIAVSACTPTTGVNAEWHRVFLGGKPAGFLRVTETRLADGRVRYVQYTKVVLSREGTKVDVEIAVDTEEDSNGRVLGFTMEQRMSRQTRHVEGTVRHDKLHLVSRTGDGNAHETVVAHDPRAIGPYRAEAVLRKHLEKAGDQLEQVVFLAELQRCGKQRVTLGPVETVALPGGERELRSLRIELDLLPGIVSQLWVDEDFEIWKTAMPFLNDEMVTYRSTHEEVAGQDFSTPPEIFISSAIPLAERLPAEPLRAVYRLRLKKGVFDAEGGVRLASEAGQTTIRRESDSSLLIEVKRVEPARPPKRPVAADEALKPFLEANSYIQSDDPKITALAREIAGDEEDSWRAARRLETWVHDNLREKNLRTAFATAAEVAVSLEGDCTEHAVLLAALARAAGIPARVVAGLVHHNAAFLGHMWTEVHVGQWIPLDATIGRGAVNADHIALSRSSLNAAAASDLFIDIYSTVGNLEIELVEAR